MDREAWLAKLTREIDEVVTPEELEALHAKPSPRAYVGIEPSGFLHIGQGFLISNKVNDLAECGFEVTILLADWHAYINDKWDGDIEAIRACGAYLEDAFKALGCDSPRIKYVYASELIQTEGYWERVLRISKSNTVARIKRTLTIMGRQEAEADIDASKLIYPAMQAADIFALKLDLAYGGMDQRKAHMLARESADRLGWPKFVSLHSPLMTGLKGGSKMDPSAKMSKSVPDSAVFLHDSEEDIRRKIKNAWCEEGAVEGNPVLDIARFIIFRREGHVDIERPEKWGGNLHFDSYDALHAAFANKQLHPADLKKSVADALVRILAPIREKILQSPNFKIVEERKKAQLKLR